MDIILVRIIKKENYKGRVHFIGKVVIYTMVCFKINNNNNNNNNNNINNNNNNNINDNNYNNNRPMGKK